MSLRAASLVLSVGLPAAAPPLGVAPQLQGYPPSVPGHTFGIGPSLDIPAELPAALVPPAADFRSRAEMSSPRVATARPAPSATSQLQAAQPPNKPGPSPAERAFYDRVFSGAARRDGEADAAADAVDARPPEPADPTLPALKADVAKLLDHLCKTRTSWRSGAQLGEALARQVEAVRAAGGIARRRPKGWFGSEVVVEPLDRDLLAQLPRMADTLRLIARSQRQDYSDLLYSIDVLTGRAASRRAFADDLAWLYGTYRLGGI